MPKRRVLEGDSYWLEADPLGALADYDPLRETTGQARAQRRGERFIPFEKRPTQERGQLPTQATDTPHAPMPIPPPDVALDTLRRANADPALYASGLKVLLVVVTTPGDAPISLSRFMDATGLSKNGVIAGIRNALDGGYITREQSCPRCNAPLPFSEDQKTTDCAACARSVAPQARYTLCLPTPAIQSVNSPVHSTDSPVQSVNRAVQPSNSLPVHSENSPVHSTDRSVGSAHRGASSLHSPPVQLEDRGAVHSVNSPVYSAHRGNDRYTSATSRIAEKAVQSVNSPVHSADCPRARADSDSESNITNDSVYMGNERHGHGNAAKIGCGSSGRSETEQMAQISCKALEDNAGSLGMHIKTWAHAKQMDANTGAARHQTALAAIQRELTQQRATSGQAQGKAWTRRVCDYFAAQGQPLPKSGRK